MEIVWKVVGIQLGAGRWGAPEINKTALVSVTGSHQTVLVGCLLLNALYAKGRWAHCSPMQLRILSKVGNKKKKNTF